MTISRTRRSQLVKSYVWTVALIVVAFLLRHAMVDSLESQLAPFITFYPAVMFAALQAGIWAGLLATLLSALLAYYWILPNLQSNLISGRANDVNFVFFVGMGILMSLMAERYRRLQQRQSLLQSEAQLRETTEFKELATDTARMGTWEIRTDTGEVTRDENCRKMFGAHPDEPVRLDTFFSRIHPDDRQMVDDLMKQALAGDHKVLWGMEYRVLWPDGSTHWLASYGRAYDCDKPDCQRFLGVCMEITERKLAEEKLRRSELLHRGLFNSMDEGFCVIEMIYDSDQKPVDWRWLEVNAAFEKQSGLMNPIGKRLREFHPDYDQFWFDAYANVALTGEPMHVNESKGLDRCFEIRAYRVGEPQLGHVAVLFKDIGEQKNAEEHIRKLNRVYSVLTDINQTIVREKDSQAMLAAACRIAVEKGRFRMAWIGMLDPATQEIAPLASSGIVDGYLDPKRITFNIREQADGPSARCIHSSNYSICNDIENDPLYLPWRDEALRRGYRSSAAFPLTEDGKTIGILCLYADEPQFFDENEIGLLNELAIDISFALEVDRNQEERRKSDDELRWRTAFFEALVESDLDGILVVDQAGKKILQNRRLNELMKIPPAIARSSDDSPQIQFVATLVKNREQFLEKVNFLSSHPTEISRDEIEMDDGTILDRYSSPVKSKSGEYYGRIWSFHDITGRRQLERQFRQAQKMEAVGQLTGGIAHDFNNLLAIILGNLELLERAVSGQEAALKRVQTAQKAGERGADLTRRLLTFSRSAELRPAPVNLNHSVRNVIELARALGPDMMSSAQCGNSIPPVQVDASGLENALLNLVINARDAMPGGGSLAIATSLVQIEDSPLVKSGELKPGSYASILVSDTGEGMSSETLERVFEPFFTTKALGKGTGLGLAMVYGFIKQSGGAIRVDSEPGRGTTFTLYLPLAAAEPMPVAATVRSAALGSRKILVVDDEPALLEIAKTYLKTMGHTVYGAAEGAGALQVIRQHPDIDLMITDIIMPGNLNGVDLAKQVRELLPAIRVVYTSGYPKDAMSDRGLPRVDGQLLGKPYRMLEFETAVNAALQ